MDSFRARAETVRHLQVRRHRQDGQDRVQVRPVRAPLRDGTRQRLEALRHNGLPLEGPQVDDRAQGLQSLRLAHEHLRGAPRQLASLRRRQLSELRCARRPAHPLCQADGLHAHRAHARDGISLRGQLGLPGDGDVRPHIALRHAQGFHGIRRPLPPCGHRRDTRLGARALPPRRTRPRHVRRHAALRVRRPQERGAQGVGHQGLRLRQERGQELPHLGGDVLV